MRTLVLLALLLTAFSCARSAELEGPDAVAEHTLGRFTVTDLPAGSVVFWDVFPEATADFEEVAPGRLIVTATPGPYTLKARVVSLVDGQLVGQSLRLVFAVEGDSPQPNPEPDPGPAPTPGPRPETALERAARDYTGNALIAAAREVRDGRARTAYEAMHAYAAARDHAHGALARMLSEATRPYCDANWTILDRDGYASVLESAARAMGAKR